MKKFWMISMLAIAALFFVSCGGDEDDDVANTGDTVADTGADTGSDTGDTGDNGGDTGADTATDTGVKTDTDTGDNGDTVADISDTGDTTPSDCKYYADCLNSCVYGDPNYDQCRQTCYNNTSPQGRSDYEKLYYCAKDNGCLNLMSDDAAYTECMTNNCRAEAAKCDMLNGSGTEADTRYNSPYGHLTLNFSVDQIATTADLEEQNQASQQQQQSDNKTGQVSSPYAVGNYGNSASIPVIPDGIDQILSSAGYRNEDGFEGVSISQTFAIQTGTQNNQPQYAMSNPAVVLKIDKTAFAVAQIDVSPFNNPKAYIQVLEMNWDDSSVKCVHAYGEGTLNITTATGDIANHGALAFTGEVDLYNMRNFKGYSYDQKNDACEPVN